MKRRIISLLLTLVMLLSIVPVHLPASAATEDYYTYTVTDGKVTITTCDSAISGDITIPSTLGGYPVTGIGERTFYNCDSLNGITIPESVTSIGEYAFSFCDSLTSITIPKGITSIGEGSFYYCTSLISIAIPEGVTSIGEDAFSGCDSLTSITIPESVTNIGDYAFSECFSLTEIWVDEDNPCFCSDSKGVLFTKDMKQLKQAPGGIGGHYAIPESITSISSGAFSGCSSLTGITIPECVTCIGLGTFSFCSSLTGITIPQSITSIGNGTFLSCTSLTSITIPEGVTSIGYGAFSGCFSLTDIKIPTGVTSIGGSAFSYCFSLPSVTIPEGVISIGEWTFYTCTSLTSITIPDGVTSIGYDAFFDCSSLTSITIPESVTSIDDGAFNGCTVLETVYYCGSKTQWEAILIDVYNDELLNANIIPEYCQHSYESAVTKEPTKTETGVKTYTCTVCGDSYTETIPALFYGANIDMGNSLDLNFYFYNGVVGTDGHVEFVHTFADGTTETTQKSLSQFGFNGDYYQITYPDIAAMEMNDAVSITVYDANGNAVSETKTDSICTYVRRALDNITDPVSRRMYVDMLSYGVAAQQNFGYDTEHFATDILTPEEKAEGTQSLAPITNNYTRSNNNYYGTNFDLENEIKLNLYVLASAMGENGYAEITYTNFKGEEITQTVTQYSTNGDYYVFTPDFVVAADGRCLLTIKFCKADGTEVVTVIDSMESYVARAVEKNPEKYNWMKQMLIYSDSACAYLLQRN